MEECHSVVVNCTAALRYATLKPSAVAQNALGCAARLYFAIAVLSRNSSPVVAHDAPCSLVVSVCSPAAYPWLVACGIPLTQRQWRMCALGLEGEDFLGLTEDDLDDADIAPQGGARQQLLQLIAETRATHNRRQSKMPHVAAAVAVVHPAVNGTRASMCIGIAIVRVASC